MNKKYNYTIFSPYFGKLPNNFNLWLNSCSYNKEFKFIVFTDDKTKFDIPENVEMIYLTFEEFKSKIQSKFKFKIALNNPYKLCDYKPTYGYIFQEYLKDCKYWGYCDIDLIFGNLKKFMPQKVYDKISFLGHFCMYKNTDYINDIFMDTPPNTISYKEILSNNHHFGFDEIGNYGINNIFKLKGLSTYNYEINVADIDCRKEGLQVIRFENEKFIKEKRNKIFEYNNGEVYSIDFVNKEIVKKEYAYIHFQKRKMKNMVSNANHFFITYDRFIDYFKINYKDYIELNPPKYKIDTKWIRFKCNGIKRRIKRALVIEKIKKGSRK